MIHSKSWTRRVLEYIEQNPGSTRAEIYKATNTGQPIRSLSSILRRLREMQAIKIHGRPPHKSRWYAVEVKDPSGPYGEIALDLIAELEKVHHTNRATYLANRLEEIFE